MYDGEVEVLRRIGLERLARLCGSAVLNAIKIVYNTNLDRELAVVLVLKSGDKLFDDANLRKDIIDTLTENETRNLCNASKINYKNHIDGIIQLHQYYCKGYNANKSKIFVNFFNLNKRYVKKVIVDERSDSERIVSKKDETVYLKPYLHDYQKRIKDTILERLSCVGSKLMVQMPTGSGKTFTSLEAVVDLLRLPFQKKFAVWIVYNNELAEQALQSFKYIWKVKGDRELNSYRLFKDFEPCLNNEEGGMIFASFQKFNSILTNTAHKYYNSLWNIINNTEILIIDEAHKSVAETYSQCINAFINNGGAKILGLTATPGRNCLEESLQLSEMFSNNITSITDCSNNVISDAVGYLQDGRYLAKTESVEFETGLSVAWTNQEDKLLASLAENTFRNEKVIEQIELSDKENDSTIVFACTKDHVIALQILCIGRGIKSSYITGDVDQVERIAILNSFKNREFNILINADMLSTGIDLPNVNKLIITRPITSIVLYSQIIGRALRGPKNGGNETNKIVNLRDNILNYPSGNFIYNSFSEYWR
ncbi:DEAD/DEAH box helicase [Geoalkalibacter halelectricus]|uniref:DEAD/DEAH box helicase n=1 Tax=Geoalkalibacter halelectricus TaxID=2847045 RepID=UPI00266F29CE|nr:DEAD/DEAH box helicase family protein [Geoalkalibacter halelectricus]MDO3380534.1 DEAD/DEAH box helicase family protein [Geoalkalibacter halelectricus]